MNIHATGMLLHNPCQLEGFAEDANHNSCPTFFLENNFVLLLSHKNHFAEIRSLSYSYFIHTYECSPIHSTAKYFHHDIYAGISIIPLRYDFDVQALFLYTLWRHQMRTLYTLLALCAGNSSMTGDFPAQSPVTRSFVFFDLRLNKRLNKQSWDWWFETPQRPLWRHCNDLMRTNNLATSKMIIVWP